MPGRRIPDDANNRDSPGGGALLWGLDKRIADRTRIPVTIAEAPMDCVAIGTGQARSHMGRISAKQMTNQQDF